MFDLTSSGLNLRELKATEYGQFIEDLNYNFTQILNLPGFKGSPGASITGAQGIGIRGSKWIFVKLSDLKPVYDINTSDQIDLNLMNTLFLDDSTKLFTALDIPLASELLIGDICVLPSGQIIELTYIEDEGDIIKFADTGITFAQVATVSESRVIEIFNDLFQGGNQTEGALRYFNAVAKNNTDKSPALNRNVNNDSVIDIVVSNSGPGAAMSDFQFVAPPEQRVGDLTKMCLIAGSPQRYHKLIQETQRIHTNNYAPGVDDFAAQVVLQNSHKNGIIFGHKNSESIRNFGRLYKSNNATILTSSYSPLESEYSEINLFDTQALIRAVKATIKADTTEILSATFDSPYFTWSGNIAKLANGANKSLEIYAPAGTFFKNILSANVLSTDAQGKLTKIYSVLSSMPATPSNQQLLSAFAVKTYMDGVLSTLSDLTGNVDDLLNRDTSGFFKKQDYHKTSTNLNSVTKHGNSLIKAGTTISNFVPGITSAPYDMHINVFAISSGDDHRLLQEITIGGATVNNMMAGIKWFRNASKTGAGQWSFSLWSKTVTNADIPTTAGPIAITGDFANGMKISHGTSTAQSTNNFNNSQVVKNVTLDQYGHISDVKSIDLANVFHGVNGPINGMPWSPTNNTTLKNVLLDLINQNRPKVIITGTMDIGGSGGGVGSWFTVPYTDNPKYSAGHNLKDHSVKWKRTRLSDGADFLDIEIKLTGPALLVPSWEWNRTRVLGTIWNREVITRGEPLYPAQEIRTDAIPSSSSGTIAKRFYIGEGGGHTQSAALKIIVQHNDILIVGDNAGIETTSTTDTNTNTGGGGFSGGGSEPIEML